MFGLSKDQGGLSRLAGLGDGRLGLDGQGPQQSRILQNQHNVQQGLADNFTPSKDWQVCNFTPSKEWQQVHMNKHILHSAHII